MIFFFQNRKAKRSFKSFNNLKQFKNFGYEIKGEKWF